MSFHPTLSTGRWRSFTLMEQLGHIGSEVDRAIHWRQKGDLVTARKAIDRGLELIDLTVDDPRFKDRLKELLRLREVLCDYFYGDNEYQTVDDSLKRYFLTFAMAARKDL